MSPAARFLFLALKCPDKREVRMSKLTRIASLAGKAAHAVPKPIKDALADQVRKTADQFTPSPEQVARKIEETGDRLRQKAPEAMQRAHRAASGAVKTARKHAPHLLSRAQQIADDMRQGSASQGWSSVGRHKTPPDADASGNGTHQ